MKKKQVVIDSSGNPVECFTVGQVAKRLGIDMGALKLQLFKLGKIPFYKVTGKSGKRVIRITKKDLDDLIVDKAIYDRIADRIRSARAEHVQMIKGISQVQLAKELGVSQVYMNGVEQKRHRISIKSLAKIAQILDKDLMWFLD